MKELEKMMNTMKLMRALVNPSHKIFKEELQSYINEVRKDKGEDKMNKPELVKARLEWPKGWVMK